MAAALVWALGLVRVLVALRRKDSPSLELALAWLVVIVAPIVLWKEITARRGRSGDDRQP